MHDEIAHAVDDCRITRGIPQEQAYDSAHAGLACALAAAITRAAVVGS
jgi:hypothetical protein